MSEKNTLNEALDESPKDLTHKKQKVDNKNFAYLRDKDKEKVRGIFHFHECPGGILEFCFRKWKGDEIESYSLQDGQIYTLPLGVAHHLNNNIRYPQYSYLNSEEGILMGHGVNTSSRKGTTMKVTSWTRRCTFQSLDFVDIADLTPIGVPADN
jgi:hypothetical protein